MAAVDVVNKFGSVDSALRKLKRICDRNGLPKELRKREHHVKDSETKEPAAEEAARIVDMMRDRGVLLSTDGPYHNVIKIKPPMVVNEFDIVTTLSHIHDVLNGTQDTWPKD